MTHAIRNTLILLLVFLIMAGSAWSYLHFYQEDRIAQLESTLQEKEKKLQSQTQVANLYEDILNKYGYARYYYKHFDKTLFPSEDPDLVYDMLNNLNTDGARVTVNFTFQDSLVQDQFGIINNKIEGQGRYRNVVNFIRRIEASSPINKVRNVSLTPAKDAEEPSQMFFSFILSSYYDRGDGNVKQVGKLEHVNEPITYNAFFPLIRDVPPNSKNLVNVENSKLIGISPGTVYLVDQNGKMQSLDEGAQVYLGNLEQVDMSDGSATFELNKGGIIEQVTLEVQE